ncbi:MAG: hypothetical protein Q7T37_00170 [bacterium]|nr:hypothetical protein [bacterium]MDO8742736.1 hypothetical protein [bacterium]
MALFAHELRYVAYDMGLYFYFLSLVGLSHQKGALPIKFLLVRHLVSVEDSEQSEFKMMSLGSKNPEAVAKHFWPANEEDVERQVLQYDSRWEESTPRISDAGIDGWYSSPPWVKVSMPKQWRRKRSKTAVTIEHSETEIRKLEEIQVLKYQRAALWRRRRILKGYNAKERRYMVLPLNLDEYERLGTRIDRINGKILRVATMKRSIDAKFLKPPLRLVSSTERKLQLV